jgi:hypothetical protein
MSPARKNSEIGTIGGLSTELLPHPPCGSALQSYAEIASERRIEHIVG